MGVITFYEENEPVPFRYLTPTRTGGQFPPPYASAMTPIDYLEFAAADLQEGSPRGYVNAFGNAKRSLHLAIDLLLHQFGLFIHFRRSRFPEKLRLLDQIGVLPITIMENLNIERNLLEHEYDVPDQRRVAEAVDVIRLLLLAIEKLMEQTPFELAVGWKNPKIHLLLQLDPLQGTIELFKFRGKGLFRKVDGVNCFTGFLRTMSGGMLLPGVTIAKKPWKKITLNRAGIQDWKPIISELVNVQRKQRLRTVISNAEATITMPVTIPIESIDGRPFAELLDELIIETFEKRSKSKPAD